MGAAEKMTERSFGTASVTLLSDDPAIRQEPITS